MKAGTVVKLALALLIAGGATYAVKPELFKDILPASLTGKTTKKSGKKADKNSPSIKNIGIVKGAEWVDCAKVREKVAAEISKKVGNMSDASVAEFIKTPENRLLLAQWIIADAELRSLEEVAKAAEERGKKLEKLQKELSDLKADIPAGVTLPSAVAWNVKNLEEQIAKLEAAQKSDYTLAESAAGKGGSKLMEMIGGDPEWAEQFAFTGECIRPGMALSILKKISKDNPDMIKNRMVRDIATATALEYAKSNWDQQDAVERANFYIESWKDDRLNTVFDTLPFWQRRMVCGCKGDNPYGSVASLRWAQDNMRLPADRYSGSCWRCAYRLNNIYGDSIHGPLYYAPFESELGDNREAMTYLIGGVCGSLSHFGAFAALANGVPALTAGEPGHCAFIVLVGDKWTPAYSLSWDRGLHWQVFRNVHSYSSLHSATEMYSAEQKAETQLSNTWRVLGGVKAAAGDIAQATACYEKAAKAQPRNWMAWREWRETLEKSDAATASHWTKLNDTLCSVLVPLYPEMAFENMQKGLLNGLAKALGNNPAQLRKAYLKFWQSVGEMGPDRWHIERLADSQLSAMGISKNVDEICSFYSEVITPTISNAKYGPAIMNWGNNLGKNLGKEGNSRLTQAMVKAIGAEANMSKEERIKLLTPAILAAEQSQDIAAFQSMGKMIKEMGHKNPELTMPAIEPFPGKLASEGGLVWMSSTSQWDKPHEHAGLLTPAGGTFHTGKDKDAHATVLLPRQVNVTGIVIVASPGNMHRLNNMKIQVSENGKDWTDVEQLGPCKQRVMRVDLSGKLPVAKYVRILRPGGPEFFHLNGIFIYGNQAA
ncbi:MAG: discoidin domain-containing protein [Akkermansia sp.]|nr:discoidin domain-containing protein [Akkermansia sp.]